MRMLRFRGKDIETGKWIVGMNIFLCCDKERTKFAGWMVQQGTRVKHTHIESTDGNIWKHETNCVTVDVETICQYTGLKDRDGKDIFEGDVIEGGDYNDEDGYGEIIWDDDTARFAIIGRHGNNLISDFDNYYGHELRVIGNIYDNPELVE